MYRINNIPLLIRGAGWTPQLFLERSKSNYRTQLELAKRMGLNAIRLEGKFEDEFFYALADKFGLLLIPGWACCDAWQHWSVWQAEQFAVAKATTLSEARRLRRFSSILAFWYSSDELPPKEVEIMYLDAFAEANWPNPTLQSAAQTNSSISGPSGGNFSFSFLFFFFTIFLKIIII